VPFALIALLGVLYGLIAMLGGGVTLATWAPPVAALGACASLLYAAARRPRPRLPEGQRQFGRDAWRCFGTAAGLWCVGSSLNAIFKIVLTRAVVTLSLGDLFHLAAILALAAGFAPPIRVHRTLRAWVRYVADTYVCAGALFVVGWVTLFGGLYRNSGESASEFVIEMLYPLVDGILVCAFLPFVLGTRPGQRRSAWMAYVSLLALTAADIVTMSVRLHGGTVPGDVGDVIRFFGLLVLGAAPWIEHWDRPSAEDDEEVEDPRGTMIGPGIATAAVAGAAGVFVAGHSLTASNGIEPVVSAVAGTALVVLFARLADLIRENERLRRAVGTEEEHFRVLAETIDDVVMICDYTGVVRYLSAGAEEAFSYSPGELLDTPLVEILHPEDLPRVVDAFEEFVGRLAGGASGEGDAEESDPDEGDSEEPDEFDFEDDYPEDGEQEPVRERVLRLACRVRAADGTWLPTESTITPYGPRRLLVTTRDLSEQAALQRQVTHLTFHDGLTGLPNRAYFEERTREVLDRRQGTGRIAVLFTDLDGFTAVNDSAGHAAGDQVLAQAARRLRAAVQVNDTVARWGGDEFAVLVENPADGQAVVDLAERLLRVLSAEPYRVGSRGIALTASVGLALSSPVSTDAEGGPGGGGLDAGQGRGGTVTTAAELIRNGDLAMARAKELGGGRVELFAAHMHTDVVRRLELGGDLQRALAEEQFSVEFQPVVDLTTSRVTGVEALVRWWRGSVSVPPEEFIGPAEESGLMIPLGNWVLREACREVARWRDQAWDIGLSVNFTARQIAAPKFMESVAEALEETGLPPEALTLEVREEVLVEDAGQNVERLSALRDLGVRLAIDDFGTGYASLAHLGRLPVDVIKIDPSFVAGLGEDETLTLLTSTIIRLGRDLGLTVVAEGIERPEQLDLLRELGCPRGQGYLVARPMAPGRVEVMVRNDQREGYGRSDDVSNIEISIPRI
jgi:diguanylate cyclase (GGDEF)-like protein